MRAGHPFDAHAPGGLRGVEGGGVVVGGGGQHDEGGGVEPAPEVPEVVLDAADLGREVVGDEQVTLHAPPGAADGRRPAGGYPPGC